ncbi:MAG: prolipoprotein diacylglyceryl transferase [Ruminococcaceae bacterium]|nr:prolipoprotein diacylglyceryl transferase [Oscillospiraceae bacterium]
MDYYIEFPKLGWRFEVGRVAFEITDSISVKWYGVIICVALLLCVFLGFRCCEKYCMSKDDLMDYILITVPAAIIGARLYYVIFTWDSYKDNLWKIFAINEGGLAIYGGIIAAIISVVLISKVKKIKALKVVDFMLPYICLGQAIGRWGNFFNQEAHGGPTDLPWGMTGNLIATEFDETLVHPTFFYESMWCLIAFAVMMVLRKKMTVPGQMTAIYFIFYGAERAFVEGLRTDSLMWGPVRVSQILSVLLLLLGVGLMIYFSVKKKSTIEAEEVEDDNAISRVVKAMEKEEAIDLAVSAGETNDQEGIEV